MAEDRGYKTGQHIWDQGRAPRFLNWAIQNGTISTESGIEWQVLLPESEPVRTPDLNRSQGAAGGRESRLRRTHRQHTLQRNEDLLVQVL